MRQLWAPWRMAYVGQKKDENSKCIFCQAASGSEDAGSQVLHVTEFSVVMLNRYPYSNGHIMVAPKRHVATVEGLESSERLDLMDMMALSCKILRDAMSAQGFNAGFNLGQAAGAGIPGHLHLHVVPRWSGDLNFMTALADVRIISEHLQATYQKLKQQFDQFKGDTHK